MEITKIGPVGGPGGETFGSYMIPEGARLAAIHVFAHVFVEGLGLEYWDEIGQQRLLAPVGIAGGTKHVIQLGSNEHIIGVSGHYGWFVDSLRVHTNRRTSELFGGPGGDHSYELYAPQDEEVVGFFGNAAWYIDAVGILTRPLASPND